MVASPPAGYAHAGYAASLGAEEVRALPRSGGHLLLRPTPALPLRDAAGPYPILCCTDWSGLADDLAEAGRDLVSVVAVTDPFAGVSPDVLAGSFGDRVVPYKRHHVVDLRRGGLAGVSPHHRRNARRALEAVAVEELTDPAAQAAEWGRLYRHLVARHAIEGIADFPPEALARQLRVPGLVAFRAVHQDATVGMLLFYVQGPVAYYHLGAHDETGYRLRASFGLFARAIERLGERGVDRLDLGAGPGDHDDPDDGLARFKRGWTEGTETVYLCGRVFDREAYARLCAATGTEASAYFPAYRARPAAG